MADKRLNGKRIAMVIAPENFRDEELFTPRYAFEEAGAQVKLASVKEGEAHGMLGGKAKIETLIDHLSGADYDAIVVVGGMGSPEYLWDNAKLHNVLTQAHKANKVVAAICLSGAALAKAGVLSGKKATVWATSESLKALQDGKATYVKEHVVEDGNLITADGPEAAPEFANRIVEQLAKVKV